MWPEYALVCLACAEDGCSQPTAVCRHQNFDCLGLNSTARLIEYSFTNSQQHFEFMPLPNTNRLVYWFTTNTLESSFAWLATCLFIHPHQLSLFNFFQFLPYCILMGDFFFLLLFSLYFILFCLWLCSHGTFDTSLTNAHAHTLAWCMTIRKYFYHCTQYKQIKSKHSKTSFHKQFQ